MSWTIGAKTSSLFGCGSPSWRSHTTTIIKIISVDLARKQHSLPPPHSIDTLHPHLQNTPTSSPKDTKDHCNYQEAAMNDQAPQLGNIPQYSEMNIPTLGSNDNDTSYEAGTHQSTQDAKNTVYSSQVSFMHPLRLSPMLITRLISITLSSRDTCSFVDHPTQMLNQQ